MGTGYCAGNAERAVNPDPFVKKWMSKGLKCSSDGLGF